MTEVTAISIPIEDYNRGANFALDIGGSLIKLAYKSETVTSDKKDCGQINLKYYPREQFDECIDFIKNNCLRKNGEDENIRPTVFTTGVGCSKLKEEIEERLGISLVVLIEMVCLTEAFTIISKENQNECIYLDIPESVKEIITLNEEKAKEMMKIIETSKAGKELNDVFSMENRPIAESNAESEDSDFPALLIMSGSGTGYVLLNEDGTFNTLAGSTSGGRKFLGLGSLLTGAKSYEELISYASNGNEVNVDSVIRDLTKPGQEDLYSAFSDFDFTAYAFGKAVYKDIADFKKEDLACALLNNILRDYLMVVQLLCHNYPIRTIHCIGTLMESEFSRGVFTLEFEKMWMMIGPLSKIPKPKVRFLEAGPFLGAIGALTHRFCEKTKNADSEDQKPAEPKTIEQDKKDSDTSQPKTTSF